MIYYLFIKYINYSLLNNENLKYACLYDYVSIYDSEYECAGLF